MKRIKLSGREATVVRRLDFYDGTTGPELIEQTQMEMGDLLDIVNGLLEAGYLETRPFAEKLSAESLLRVVIEVNPAFAQDLRESMRRG